MDVVDVLEQTMLRAGGGQTRLRGTEEFERSMKNWQAVERPERVLSRMEQLGMRREVLSLTSSLARGGRFIGFNPLERIIRQNDLMSSFFLSLGAKRARAVGRVVTRKGVGVGTGFLVSPRLMMTNNHVIEDERIAERILIEFDYVRRFDGVIDTGECYGLLPAEFFLTSVTRDGLNLDYTIVAVEAVNPEGRELAARGSIPLGTAQGGLITTELANIIQHPGGEPQQVALRDNKVVESLEHFIRYEADTQPGSSGSPVFNDQWQLAALHHSGVPRKVKSDVLRLRNGGEWDTRAPLPHASQVQLMAQVDWVSNEGVLIGSIVADARARLAGDGARLALFEEAVREQPPPLAERVFGDGAEAAGVVVASAHEAAARAAQGTVTWTIPLQVTVQLGPDLRLSQPRVLSTPAPPSPPTPAVNDGLAPRQQSPDTEPAAALGLVRELLGGRAGVLEVRDGFLWRGGLTTERRAAVVVLDPRVPVAAGDPYEVLRIPRELDGLPVDVTLGGPAALLRAAGRGKLLACETRTPADPLQGRASRLGYVKPELSVDELCEPMQVICHVSPDDGWPVLNDFLSRVEKTLTLGTFEITAPHVVAKLRELAEGNTEVRFNLSTRRGLAGGSAGVNEKDLDGAEVIEGLRETMGGRLRQAYVNVSGDGRSFAGSYRVNAAVRDGEELWLSSGDMRSSSQPPSDLHPADDGQLLRSYDREWHVVVRNRKLARTFDAYLLHELKAAEANPAAAAPPAPADDPLFEAGRLESETVPLEEAAPPPRYFTREVLLEHDGAPVTVRPLLTPDDYTEHVVRLVRSARRTLFVQTQSPALLDPPESDDDASVELWRAVRSRQDAGVDVRIIFRVRYDEDEARAVKDCLVKLGLRPECIRFQKGCHAKGVVVDSEAVLVGSHAWTSCGVKAACGASLLFRHPEIASYYERVFLFDWKSRAREPRPADPDLIGRGHPGARVEAAQPDRTQPGRRSPGE